MKITSAAAAIVLVAGLAAAAEINIGPGDSLQEAIDIANPGDAIVLAPGAYLTDEPIQVFVGGLTIRAVSGPADTVIALTDDGFGSLLEIDNPGFVLEGVTLQAPAADDAILAEVRINQGKALFRDVVFSNASGGVTLDSFGTTIVFENCVFERLASIEPGVAVSVRNETTAVFRNTTFRLNETTDDGVVFADAGSLSFVGCSFSDNTAHRGGAIYANNSSDVSVSECSFHANESTDSGGAIWVRGSTLMVLRSEFTANAAESSGAAIVAMSYRRPQSQVVVDGCTFVDNDASNIDAVALYSPLAMFTNNLVVVGSEAIEGVQVRLEGNSMEGAVATNNTFVGPGVEEPLCSALEFEGGPGRVANNIFIGWGGAVVSMNDNVDFSFNLINGVDNPALLGEGNFSADPMFVDVLVRDFRLAQTSPAIDAGSNEKIGPDALDLNGNLDRFEPLPVDKRAQPRIVDGNADETAVVDLGAFEFNADADLGACPADFSGDRRLDIADVVLFLQVFGAGCP
ncbi:MAG: hypothetical protein CMJ31_04985 [Phycisphaerae bacterium]|nr:hypothetical protein [Phycisphaerae bacterium]